MPSEVPIRNDGLLEELRRELADARDREAAANEVLRAVAATSAAVKGPVRDLQSVLGALTEAAVRLSRADKGLIRRRDGDRYVAVSGYGFSGTFREWAAENVLEARGDSIVAQAATTRATVHIPDVLAEPGWSEGDWQRLADFRSAVAVPLLSGGDVLGVLVVHRTEPAAFTDRQLQVLQTFTDQAVIAIENARLLADLTEVIEQQGTTGEILRAIANAPTSADGVLSSIAESAARVLNVSGAEIMRVDGASLTLVAKHGSSHQWPMGSQRKITREWVTGRAIVDRATVHVADLQAAADEFPEGAAYARQYGHKTTLAAPLLSEGNPIGAILIRRSEVRPFSKKQIALLETLADQAVIAIENTRLFEAEQASKRELKESLEYQTATSEVLSVISRSPTQLQPVLDTIARTSQRLCEADRSSVWRLVDGAFQVVATSDYSRAIADYMTREPVPADRSSLAGRCVLEKSTLHVHDRLNEPDLPPLPQSYATGARTLLCVPLLREGEPIGVVRLSRDKVAPFTERQIALVETFADQAVIAIENTRLFEVEQAGKRELTQSLEYQTAISEVLGVISRSPTDTRPVFESIAQSATKLCRAQHCNVFRFDGELIHIAGTHLVPGMPP